MAPRGGVATAEDDPPLRGLHTRQSRRHCTHLPSLQSTAHSVVTSQRQAEDQATFTYFPYVGDVADKKWVAELKELYEKGESLRANDLSRTSISAAQS